MTHPIHDQVRSALEACGVTVPEGTDLHARTPITGEQLMGLRATTDAEYETAVTTATEAFSTWRDTPAPVRGNLVRRWGELLTEHKDEIGRASC